MLERGELEGRHEEYTASFGLASDKLVLIWGLSCPTGNSNVETVETVKSKPREPVTGLGFVLCNHFFFFFRQRVTARILKFEVVLSSKVDVHLAGN